VDIFLRGHEPWYLVSYTNHGNVIMAVSRCWRGLEEKEDTTFIARQQCPPRPNPWRGPTRCRQNLGSRKTRRGTRLTPRIYTLLLYVRSQNKLYNRYNCIIVYFDDCILINWLYNYAFVDWLLRNTSNYLCLSLLDTSRRTPTHQNYRSISLFVPDRYGTG